MAKKADCNARVRPFPNETEVRCEVGSKKEHELEGGGGHEGRQGVLVHEGVLRDYAYPGSETVIRWLEDDRRTFHGKWPGACEQEGCPLPKGHDGSHAQ